jgi:hypothetical protein
MEFGRLLDDPGLCSFKFTSGQCSLEVLDVVIASCVDGYSDTSTTYKINIHTMGDCGEQRCDI